MARRKEPPVPLPGPVLASAGEVTRDTVNVALAGYEKGTNRENALLNLLISFTLSSGFVRLATHQIRRRGTFGPFRNLVLDGGTTHVHHFVPGIVLAFLSGCASIVMHDEELDKWLAVPFGAGVALTLDESALLLTLDDVYWTEEGVVSVQITMAALMMLSTVALALRVLRRGEAEIFGEDDDPAG